MGEVHIAAKQFKISRILLMLLLVLFGAAILIPSLLGMHHMTIQGIMNLSLDWMAMFVLIIIYGNCIHARAIDNTKEFCILILTLYICVFFEVGIWLFDTLASFRLLNYLCNIGCNSAILIGNYRYYLFIRKSRGIDVGIFPWMQGVICTAMISGIAAEVMNCVGGYFYVIDKAGVYIRGRYGSFLGYIPFILMLGGTALFIIHQKLCWKTKLKYMSYGILPFVSSLWYTFTGYPPTFFVATAMSILMIYGNIYVVQSKDAEFYELESAKKEAEYALSRNMQMLAQIKPHFLYNVLGSIEVLCKLDQEKATRAIHHFSQYLQSNMDVMNNSGLISFSQELEHIRNYIWLEHMRFEDELEYKEEIETTDFRVPQLSVQPIVENAVKHGMMGKADGILHVILKTQETESEYRVCICDDGCGFNPAEIPEDGKSHIGIRSAQVSLRLLAGGEMTIDSQIGVGTTVTIHIPKGGMDK